MFEQVKHWNLLLL